MKFCYNRSLPANTVSTDTEETAEDEEPGIDEEEPELPSKPLGESTPIPSKNQNQNHSHQNGDGMLDISQLPAWARKKYGMPIPEDHQPTPPRPVQGKWAERVPEKLVLAHGSSSTNTPESLGFATPLKVKFRIDNC